MAEIISCPSCRRKLQAPETLQGHDVQCPSCGATFTANFAVPPPPYVRPAPSYEAREQRSGPGRDDYGLDEEQRQRGEWGGPRRPAQPHRGAAILTLGILALVGLVLCVPGLILGPIAWAMGNHDLAQIRAGRMDPSGLSSTSSGHTCGIVATVLGLIGLALGCLNWLGERNFFTFR
ncbi:MAG TPA: hypothetical protein VEL76_16250 [Gemmataceae bacterium]|nr:hypothetical protein [Gemmataceae bacterium]